MRTYSNVTELGYLRRIWITNVIVGIGIATTQLTIIVLLLELITAVRGLK